jgi:hypothetical protein
VSNADIVPTVLDAMAGPAGGGAGALAAEMERLASESATHAYIQTVCEDTLLQLIDGNERLRREKLALENLQEGVPAVGSDDKRAASPASTSSD